MIILLALSFWFIPRQENLYLHSDFELIKKKSHNFLIWTLAAAAVTILFLALRRIDNAGQIINVLIGIVALLIPFYFIFQTIFLSAFLLLNRIESGNRIEEKYTIIMFLEPDKQTPMIYDFRKKKVLLFDNVKSREKIQNSKSGDTIIISFNKGLLGFDFDPVVK